MVTQLYNQWLDRHMKRVLMGIMGDSLSTLTFRVQNIVRDPKYFVLYPSQCNENI